jgi:hypothetical protein
MHVTSRRCPSLAHASAVARAIRNLGENGSIYVTLQNVKVSDGSQPPMTFDLSLSESAGSRSLDRWVRAFVAS